jgi:hypothetical protein
MTNYLKMPKKSQVFALLELVWSYRRIEAETGVRRETVSRYDRIRRANAAKTFPGSDPSPPTESADSASIEGSNAAKTFAGSAAKPAETFPGSEPPCRVQKHPFRPRGCTRESLHQVDRDVGRTRHSIHLLADAPAWEEPRPRHDVVDGRCNGR